VAELKVNPDTATREELVGEVMRLLQQCNTWRDSWHGIVGANTKAFHDEIIELRAEVAKWRDIALAEEAQ
jgi:hypothetical protein